jgi:proline iminopeptidase
MGYTTARAVHDLEAVRAHSGAQRVVLLGHSWGARYAVALPSNIATMSLRSC